MRTQDETGPLIVDILVDGTLQTINDTDPSHPTSVIARILKTRVDRDGAHYRLMGVEHEDDLPLDANRVVFYHCGLASSPGRFKDHIIPTPPGTTTGRTDAGQDRMAYIMLQAVSQYITQVITAHPDRQIQINLAGHSRGAIVIGHLSNELHKRFRDIETVELHRASSIDPVAGSSAGCLITNEAVLRDYDPDKHEYPPVDTKIWGPMRHIDFYFATEGNRYHFQTQSMYGLTSSTSRRTTNIPDSCKVTVTQIATTHYHIACYADNEPTHSAFAVLIEQCYLNSSSLPHFGGDQPTDTSVPYRASMEQICNAIPDHNNLINPRITGITFFWRLANLLFSGSFSYLRPFIIRAILTLDHPLMHAAYNRSVIMDNLDFLENLMKDGSIKEDVFTIASDESHPLHAYLMSCYERSSYYQAAHDEISIRLSTKSKATIDRVLKRGQFLAHLIKIVKHLPHSTTKEHLADLARAHAGKYCETIQSLSQGIVAKAMQIQFNVLRRQSPDATSYSEEKESSPTTTQPHYEQTGLRHRHTSNASDGADTTAASVPSDLSQPSSLSH